MLSKFEYSRLSYLILEKLYKKLNKISKDWEIPNKLIKKDDIPILQFNMFKDFGYQFNIYCDKNIENLTININYNYENIIKDDYGYEYYKPYIELNDYVANRKYKINYKTKSLIYLLSKYNESTIEINNNLERMIIKLHYIFRSIYYKLNIANNNNNRLEFLADIKKDYDYDKEFISYISPPIKTGLRRLYKLINCNDLGIFV